MKLNEIIDSDIIVYHGSPKQFKQFDLSFSGNGVDKDGPGIYFTTLKYDAMRYGPYVITAKLHLNKIITSDKRPNRKIVEKMIDMAPNKDDVLTNYDENPKIAFNDAVVGIMNLNAKDAYESVWFDFYKDDNNLYCENMSKLGFDAVKIKVNGGYYYIVLNLKAIKIINYEHIQNS